MKPVIDILEERISAAMTRVAGHKAPAIVRPATDPKFGDYQVNGVMPLAKQSKTNPHKLAEQIVAKLDISDICEQPQIAGAGFINLKLKPKFVAENLLSINADKNLGVDKTKKTETVVVDFSGPNIAKQMHVGHLRSTIIGDCICRLLEFLGHTVIRQNHIGDWGLQMGMIIYVIENEVSDAQSDAPGDKFVDEDWSKVADLDRLEEIYKSASILAEHDPDIAQACREATAQLHKGDSSARGYWEHARKITLQACFDIYKKLMIKSFTNDEIRGESFYKDDLHKVVDDLLKREIAEKSDNAVCVFPPGFKDKDGKSLPVIIQKSDGAYLYATTDLAAIRYRVNELKADKIIYVTDARQQLHFQMVFAVAKMAGWDTRQTAEDGGRKTEFIHVTFGSVLGEDGKPLKTREGENVKLKELLDEAVERAKAIVEEKNPDLPAEQKDRIAKAVGIGAVKYADYSNNRTSDYVFSFDKMLAMDGNTAPYMQYAYARVQSIKDKGKERGIEADKEITGLRVVSLTEPSELDLAKHLIRYGEAIEAAVGDYRPNYLTSYLYELAQKFSVFYTDCPVLDAGPDKRPTRLLLCDLTAKTIKHGLSNLLGIEVVEQM
jgi:arginyl-tRNA synthetase